MTSPNEESRKEVKAEFFTNTFSLSFSQREQEFKEFYRKESEIFSFTDLTIIKPFRVFSTDKGRRADYIFTDCDFKDKLTFADNDCRASFSFRHCKFNTIAFERGEYLHHLNFEYCNAESITIVGGDYKEVHLGFNPATLYVAGGKFQTLFIGEYKSMNASFKRITIDCNQVSGKIEVEKTQAATFDLHGTLEESSSLLIKECDFKHFLIWQFSCKGSFTIDSVIGDDPHYPNTPQYPDSLDDEPVLIGAYTEKETKRAYTHFRKSFFTIEHVNLDNAQLANIDFGTFAEVNVYRSTLTNIQISNVTWPRRITTHFPHNSKFNGERFRKGFKLQRPDYLARREVYRQLKFASSKQHDFIGEQHFHALEMNAYDHTLRWKYEFWTKLVLKLSLWTSNFGQSVIRPLIGIFIVNGFLFYLLYRTSQTKFTGFDYTKPQNYVDTIAEFIRVVNPLHNNDPELTGWAFIIDVLIRICSSYFIYNLIRATRRFVR